jgi:hypothetical protein
VKRSGRGLSELTSEDKLDMVRLVQKHFPSSRQSDLLKMIDKRHSDGGSFNELYTQAHKKEMALDGQEPTPNFRGNGMMRVSVSDKAPKKD